jgi:methylated-DNA-[protein]-cysteine S-methyltransferase
MTIARLRLETPLGPMLALDSGTGLCALEFSGPADRHHRLDARLRKWFPPCDIVDDDTATLALTRRWLRAYFEGSNADIRELPLDMRGAAFERRVWSALCTIPPGTTTTYGAIAKAVGAPGAARAVGAANGANPVAIVVPCHRVIGSSGALTGYGGGLDRKTWLIAHERRWCPAPEPSLFDQLPPAF